MAVGKPPAPLPVSATSPPLLRTLAEIEKLASVPKTAFEATKQREALVEDARGVDPEGAATLAFAIGFDMGELGDLTRIARQGTLAALYALASESLDFQRRALRSLPSDPTLRNELLRAIFSTSRLSDEARTLVTESVLDSRPEARPLSAIAAQAAFRHGLALELIGPLLHVSEATDVNTLEHRRALLTAGGAFWSSAESAWRPILAPLASLAASPYDWTKGDAGRANLHMGQAAQKALDAMSSGALRVINPTFPSARTMSSHPHDKSLDTPAAREAALDALGTELVESLVAAGSDDARARKAIETAIKRFYDIRESGGQERGEYAGHFFRVDAVGLDNTGRPVPWTQLRARVGEARAHQLSLLFDEAEAVVA